MSLSARPANASAGVGDGPRSIGELLARGRPASLRDSLIGLAIFAAAVVIVQTLDLLFTPSDYYNALNKPSYAPPDWAFSPVWIALWVMTATAGWLVWRERGFAGAPVAFMMWGLHLVGNVVWTLLFFQIQNLDLAAFEICILWAVVVGATIAFWQVRPLAGALLVPLLGWLTFASAVSLSIAEMN